MFKYKEKYQDAMCLECQHSTLYLSKQQSTQTGCYTIAARFPFEPLQKCMTFKDIFPGLSRTKVIFHDFPGPGIFKKKIQDFPGGVGTLVYWTHVRLHSHRHECESGFLFTGCLSLVQASPARVEPVTLLYWGAVKVAISSVLVDRL